MACGLFAFYVKIQYDFNHRDDIRADTLFDYYFNFITLDILNSFIQYNLYGNMIAWYSQLRV